MLSCQANLSQYAEMIPVMMISNLRRRIWNEREIQTKGALSNEKMEEDFLTFQT